MTEKLQSPAQRLANSVWLRAQLRALIQSCAENIAEDLKRADAACGDASARYLASAESGRHWKRQLERVLRGKTFTEDLRDAVKPMDFR